jgi:glycerol-3-phosphate dehydrogenase
VLLGPTAKYVDSKDNYERDRLPISEFANDAKTLVPEIKAKDLQLAYSGIRPKLVAPGQSGIADFVIERDREVPQVIQLVGIESPGLTASTSIALHVRELTKEILG